MEELTKLKDVQFVGYGKDDLCDSAKEKMKSALKSDSDIHFITGGTQANLTVIASILKPYQGVISADSGHFYTHETGAIEACGHKILTISSSDGKIYAKDVEKLISDHHLDANSEHTTMPAMVYISNPTELGTIYKKDELKKLHDVCIKYNVPLYMDGARLAYALSALENDINLEDYKDLVDVFYIGGTKCGALFGEAIVFNNKTLSKDFRYSLKQRGGLLAKGFLLGAQFDTLFSDNLYYEIGEHANNLAAKLNDELLKRNVKMLSKRYSNQLFLILANTVIEKLKNSYEFETWQVMDNDTTAIRIVVSWASKEEKIYEFISDLDKII